MKNQFCQWQQRQLNQKLSAKLTIKKAKEDLKPSARHVIVFNHKDQEENITKSTELELRGKVEVTADTKSTDGMEKVQKEATKSNEIGAAKLKEIKKEEEIAKAKLALERKKKLAEKAAAKAAIRAQKEAEKKLKEKEKRAKKKAGASVPSPADQTEIDSEVAEPEEGNLSTEAPPLDKNKEQKKNVGGHRNRQNVKEEILKINLRRKKSHSHWMWTAPAIILILVLVISGYYFYFGKN